jgi:hypothetical protein
VEDPGLTESQAASPLEGWRRPRPRPTLGREIRTQPLADSRLGLLLELLGVPPVFLALVLLPER